MKKDVERLLEDLRLIGPAGLERAVQAWRAGADEDDGVRTTAEKKEEDDPAWQAAEAEIFQLAKGDAWRSLEQVDREAAIAAAQDALLAVMEKGSLQKSDYRRLAGPMASALPWLLTGEAEDRY